VDFKAAREIASCTNDVGHGERPCVADSERDASQRVQGEPLMASWTKGLCRAVQLTKATRAGAVVHDFLL
jgi:hypothetical protein